eukprot:m.55571 g.55571  ORF g.55571 m.55571 type:complete len:1016 (+) comp12539_c0_seq2:251-3298(+)
MLASRGGSGLSERTNLDPSAADSTTTATNSQSTTTTTTTTTTSCSTDRPLVVSDPALHDGKENAKTSWEPSSPATTARETRSLPTPPPTPSPTAASTPTCGSDTASTEDAAAARVAAIFSAKAASSPSRVKQQADETPSDKGSREDTQQQSTQQTGGRASHVTHVMDSEDDDELLAALDAALDSAAAATSDVPEPTATEVSTEVSTEAPSAKDNLAHPEKDSTDAGVSEQAPEPTAVKDSSAGSSGIRAIGTEPSALGLPQRPEVQKKSFFGVFGGKDKAAAKTPSPQQAPQQKTRPKQEKARPKDLTMALRKVDQLQAEMELHRDTKDQLARELESTKRDMDDQRQTFKSSIAQLSSANAQLESQLLAAREQLAQLGAEAAAAAAASEVDDAEASDHQGAGSPSSRSSTELAQPDADSAAQEKLKRFQQSARETIEVLQSKIEKLADDAREAEENKEIAGLKAGRLETELQTSRTELAGVRNQLKDSSAEVDTLKKLLAAAQQEAHDLRLERDAEMSVAKSQTKGTKKQIEDLELKLKWTENKLAEADNELKGTKQHLTQVQADCAHVRLDYKRVSKTVQEAEQMAAKAKASIQVAEDAKAESEEYRRRLEETQQEFNAKLIKEVAARENLEQENHLLVATGESCSKALDGANKSTAELKEKIKDLEEQCAKLDTRCSCESDKVMQLQKELMAQAEQLQLTEAAKQEAEKQGEDLRTELEDERSSHCEEMTYLTAQLSEESQRTEKLQQALQDSEDAKRMMQKKNTRVTKELARELKQAQKKLRAAYAERETPSPSLMSANTSPSSSPGSSPRSSRASSMSGLSSRTTSAGTSLSSRMPSTGSRASASPSQARSRLATPRVSRRELESHDSAALIDKVLKLRADLEKRDERIAFYESHCTDLTADIQSKGKLLQQYLVRERAGSLAPQQADTAKPRKGGLFASSKPTEAVSLQLSQEINQKMQDVLEDTLLKNMQLKEGMDVLTAAMAEKDAELHRLKAELTETNRIADEELFD